MNKTFSYKAVERWKGLLVFLPMGYIVYIFFRAFILFNDIISFVVLCVFCMLAIGALKQGWYDRLVKIVADDNGMLIKKPLTAIRVDWNDIVEYGREEHCKLYGGDRYYVKLRNTKKKKLIMFNENLEDLKVFNAYIVTKLEVTKLNNIAPGMI